MATRKNFWLCDDLADFPLIVELTKEVHRIIFFKKVPIDKGKVYSIVAKEISNRATNWIILTGNTLGLKGAASCSEDEYLIGTDALLRIIPGTYERVA